MRRFGTTEDEALEALKAAIEERIGTVTQQPVLTEADQRILLARRAFVKFTNYYIGSTPFVLAGSNAEQDQIASGSDHIPNRVVEGYAASVADHLRAWCRATMPTKDDPRPFLSVMRITRSGVRCWNHWQQQSGLSAQKTRVSALNMQPGWPSTSGRSPRQFPRHSGETDASAIRLHEEQRVVIERVCERMSFDFGALTKKGAEPSKVVRYARELLRREGGDFPYWWTICSRYAHAQTLTVMLRGVRTHVDSPHGQVIDVTTDETLLAELVEFARKATSALVKLLAPRGLHRSPKEASVR